MNKHEQVIDELSTAKSNIDRILSDPDDQHHKLRMGNAIQREINYLAMITGNATAGEQPSQILGPATHIGGQKINYPDRTKSEELKTDDQSLTELREKVETAYTEFPSKTSEEILAEYDDIIIRGVTKKSGIPINKDKPKVLSVKFVDGIKKAIDIQLAKKAEADQAELDRQLNDENPEDE